MANLEINLSFLKNFFEKKFKNSESQFSKEVYESLSRIINDEIKAYKYYYRRDGDGQEDADGADNPDENKIK